MADEDLDEAAQHSDDDDCPPFAWPHMDTGGCDHRYHCCLHHEDCVEGEDGCALYGLRKDEAVEYAAELARQAEED